MAITTPNQAVAGFLTAGEYSWHNHHHVCLEVVAQRAPRLLFYNICYVQPCQKNAVRYYKGTVIGNYLSPSVN